MKPDTWQQVKQIFNAAIEMPPADRDEYLASVCAGDPELRQRVKELLASYRSTFLETSDHEDEGIDNDGSKIGTLPDKYRSVPLKAVTLPGLALLTRLRAEKLHAPMPG